MTQIKPEGAQVEGSLASASDGDMIGRTPKERICIWCGRMFTPRRDGGKRQVFCRPTCRRGFDADGRRWVSDAIASGVLLATVFWLAHAPATRAQSSNDFPAFQVDPAWPKPLPNNWQLGPVSGIASRAARRGVA